MEKFKKILLIIAIIVVTIGIVIVGYGYYKKLTFDEQNPIATIEVEGYGTIKIELYPDEAPNTVTNFIRLANRGFYNGLTFHRTIPDFMIQGGDPNGNGTGTPKLNDIIDDGADEEYSIKGEFIANGFNNTLKHTKGVISMARSDYGNYYGEEVQKKGYDSAGSQFFIMTADNSSLDGLYAAFGKVIEGMDIVEKISNTEVVYRSDDLEEGEEAPKDENGVEIASDKPVEPPVIKSITVDTFGIDYGEPTTSPLFNVMNYLQQLYGLQ